jgi:hypothetical protein
MVKLSLTARTGTREVTAVMVLEGFWLVFSISV